MIAEVKTESCRNLRNIDVQLDVLSKTAHRSDEIAPNEKWTLP